MAEDTGLIASLGLWVAQMSIAALSRLRSHCPELRLNINLSVRQLLQEGLVSCFSALVDQAGRPRQALNLELTESPFADDNSMMLERIKALATAGFELHLDDFGTGYPPLDACTVCPCRCSSWIVVLSSCWTKQVTSA